MTLTFVYIISCRNLVSTCSFVGTCVSIEAVRECRSAGVSVARSFLAGPSTTEVVHAVCTAVLWQGDFAETVAACSPNECEDTLIMLVSLQ